GARRGSRSRSPTPARPRRCTRETCAGRGRSGCAPARAGAGVRRTCPSPPRAAGACAPMAGRGTSRRRWSGRGGAWGCGARAPAAPRARRRARAPLGARARGGTAGLDRLEHLAAPLPPWIELVGGEPIAPRLLRVLLLVVEPERAPELVVGLDEIGPERERLPEEGLRVLEHLALGVREPEVEVRVERRLAVVVEADRLRQVLDRLAEDPLLEADVAEVDARQRVRG